MTLRKVNAPYKVPPLSLYAAVHAYIVSESEYVTHDFLAVHNTALINSAGPDQTPQKAVSDHGLRCLHTIQSSFVK